VIESEGRAEEKIIKDKGGEWVISKSNLRV
jgi:hypothetical protein